MQLVGSLVYLANRDVKKMWCHNIVKLLGFIMFSSSCHKTLVVLFDLCEGPFF